MGCRGATTHHQPEGATADSRSTRSEPPEPGEIGLPGPALGSAGGVLRDILSAEVPLLLRHTELYATAAIVGITVYLLTQRGGLATTPAALLGMAVVAAIRFAAILWRLRLPVLQVPDQG